MTCRFLSDLLDEATSIDPKKLDDTIGHIACCPECAADSAALTTYQPTEPSNKHLSFEELRALSAPIQVPLELRLRKLWIHVMGCESCRRDLNAMRAFNAQPEPETDLPLLSLDQVKGVWRSQHESVRDLVLEWVGRQLRLLSEPIALRTSAAFRSGTDDELPVETERQCGPYLLRITFAPDPTPNLLRCEITVSLVADEVDETLHLTLRRAGQTTLLADVSFFELRRELGPREPGRYEMVLLRNDEQLACFELDIRIADCA